MAKRRSLEKVLEDATNFAKKKPFTSQELAAHLGVTPNRARQVLDNLAKAKVVADLGKRNSMRGKPATLWGAPGTKLTDKDTAARPPPRRRARKVRAAAGRRSSGVDTRSLEAAVESILDQVVEKGVVVEGPGGLEFTLKLAGGGGKRRTRKGPKKKATTRRKKAPNKKASTKRASTKKASTKKA
jgi:hypothetical protein